MTSALPPEMWTLIFDSLICPSDLISLSESCQHFNDLRPNIVTLLLQELLMSLLPYLHKNHLLILRQVSVKLKKFIDRILEDAMKSTLKNRTVEARFIPTVFLVLNLKYAETGEMEKFGKLENFMKGMGMQTLVGRSLQLSIIFREGRFLSWNEDQLALNFFKGVGENVWNFTLKIRSCQVFRRVPWNYLRNLSNTRLVTITGVFCPCENYETDFSQDFLPLDLPYLQDVVITTEFLYWYEYQIETYGKLESPWSTGTELDYAKLFYKQRKQLASLLLANNLFPFQLCDDGVCRYLFTSGFIDNKNKINSLLRIP